MSLAQIVIQQFDYNAQVVRNQLDGLTHIESITPAYPEGHTINWLLGHVVSTRAAILRYLQVEAVMTAEMRVRYRNGTPPINGEGAGVLPLEQLAELFDLTQERLVLGMSKATPERLAEPALDPGKTILEHIFYLHFHETYHIGQMTMLAGVMGKPTAFINNG